MENVFKAIEFAALAHHGQCRKGTTLPYIVHPLGVMQLLIEYKCSESAIIAGILHDVLEDTPYTSKDIKRKFGAYVLELVEGASEPDHDAPWEERKKHTHEFLKSCENYDILSVCCADKLHNLQSLQEDLQKIGAKTWKKFNRPYAQQKWYYEELAKIFKSKAKSKNDLFNTFAANVAKVFDK